MRALWIGFAFLATASCDKLALQDGFPCSSAGTCPSPYTCYAGQCRRQPPTDAAADVADADRTDAGSSENGGMTDTGVDAVDATPDTGCQCPGGFGCTATGTCKTTCTTSSDCHPDYFCDPGNSKCHSDVVSVACGADQTCAALADGRVVCSGRNDNGQLGIGSTGPDVADPIPVVGLADAGFVKADEHDTCAVTRDGRVFCWGPGSYADTGHLDPAPVIVKTVLGPDLFGVEALGLGQGRACAVAAGATYCWGIVGGTTPRRPTLVPGAGVPSSIAVTNSLTIAAYADSRVCPWGENENPQGQCFSPGSGVLEVVTNDATSFARLTTGVVVSWGSNIYGFLGTGADMTALDRASPPGVVVAGLNAARIAAGYTTICAVPSGERRSIACWGNVSGAVVAVPTTVPLTLTPGVQVDDLGSGVKAYSICAIISDGSLQCSSFGGAFTPVSAGW